MGVRRRSANRSESSWRGSRLSRKGNRVLGRARRELPGREAAPGRCYWLALGSRGAGDAGGPEGSGRRGLGGWLCDGGLSLRRSAGLRLSGRTSCFPGPPGTHLPGKASAWGQERSVLPFPLGTTWSLPTCETKRGAGNSCQPGALLVLLVALGAQCPGRAGFGSGYPLLTGTASGHTYCTEQATRVYICDHYIQLQVEELICGRQLSMLTKTEGHRSSNCGLQKQGISLVIPPVSWLVKLNFPFLITSCTFL